MLIRFGNKSQALTSSDGIGLANSRILRSLPSWWDSTWGFAAILNTIMSRLSRLIMCGWPNGGKNTIGWFYGFKLHLIIIINRKGGSLNFYLSKVALIIGILMAIGYQLLTRQLIRLIFRRGKTLGISDMIWTLYFFHFIKRLSLMMNNS